MSENQTPDSPLDVATFVAGKAAELISAGYTGDRLAQAVKLELYHEQDRRSAAQEQAVQAEAARTAAVQAEARKQVDAERAETERRSKLSFSERALEDHRRAVEANGGLQPWQRVDPFRPQPYAVNFNPPKG